MSKRALVTGITGQDGSYLAEHLLGLGYEVYGLIRGQANPRKGRVSQLMKDLSFVGGDMMDQGSLVTALDAVQPDEVYNLAAISFVPLSWSQAELVTEINGTGVLRILEAIRIVSGLSTSRTATGGQIRFYQASSSEMFGEVAESPQHEATSFHPRSPYGVAKAFGHFITRNYRESYGLYAVSGMLFNHESPRRGLEFVTRKITCGAVNIKLGKQDKLLLGNMAAQRDWGYAGDYVRAMHMMLQQPEPSDYVIGTGRTHRRGRRAHRLRGGRPELARLRGHRSGPGPPGRSGHAVREPRQGSGRARLAPDGLVRGAHPDDGRLRPRARHPGTAVRPPTARGDLVGRPRAPRTGASG